MELSRYIGVIEAEPETWLAVSYARGTWIRASDSVRQYLNGNQAVPLTADQRQALHRHGFLVSSRQAELDRVRSRTQYVHFGSYGIRYTMVMTYACNLRCPYCYEEAARPMRVSMSREMGQLVADAIKKEARESNVGNIGLTLYGGEPLLNLPVATSMLGDLWAWAQAEGASVRTNLITNGTLVTPEAIEALGPSLVGAQLTLEGAQPYHDRVRGTARGEPTFERILQSGRTLVDAGVAVRFRIQLNPDSWDGAEQVFQALQGAGLLDQIGIYFFPIMDIQSVCSARGFHCFHRYFPPEVRRHLWDLALQYGVDCFPLPKPLWQAPFCSFVNRHATIVDPLGNMYKCVSMVGNEDAAIGSVAKKLGPLDRQRALKNEMILVNRFGYDFPECVECECLPSCDGGCGYLGMDDTGRWGSSCDMHKDLLRERAVYRYRLLKKQGKEDAVPLI